MSLTRERCRSYIAEQLFGCVADPARDHAPPPARAIGLEVEAFPYRREPRERRVRPIAFQAGDDCLSALLVRASAERGGVARYLEDRSGEHDVPGVLDKIAFPDGGSFHFEPGGQVEIATAPCTGLDELAARLADQQLILRGITDECGVRFAQCGTSPWFGVDEIGLQVRKPRYVAMDEYFAGIGPYGRQMMRQTCSVQVNVGLAAERTTCTRQLVAAQLLAPFATALFAHSPVVARKAVPQASYRSLLWRRLDRRRTGIPPLGRAARTFDVQALVDAYTEFALAAPVVHVEELGPRALPPRITLAAWLEQPIDGLSPTIEHLRSHLSLLFPEVRPRGHVELRSIDAPPFRWQLVPAAFYAGLLLADRALERALAHLLPLAPRIEELLEQAAHGLVAPAIAGPAKALMELAIEGLATLSPEVRGRAGLTGIEAFHERFTARGRTLADDYRAGFDESNKEDDSLLRELAESYDQL
jgi:glutamate--cysteine ligase